MEEHSAGRPCGHAFDLVRDRRVGLQPQPAVQEELPCELGDQGGGHVDRSVEDGETVCDAMSCC